MRGIDMGADDKALVATGPPALSTSPEFNYLVERATGLEPATSSLGSWHSTN
jgi:hypothetical protein